MTSSGKIEKTNIEKLLSADVSKLAQRVSESPILLDKLVGALADIRSAAAEKAKTRFRLTRSFWPTFESGRTRNVYVSWLARDTKNQRDIEVVYDFAKREYAVKDQAEELTPEEIKEALAMIYVILPVSELKMISIMQSRYEMLTTNQEVKRAAGRRR